MPPGGSTNVASFTGGAASTRINTGLNWTLIQSAGSSNIFVEALVYVNSFPCTIAIQGPPLATAQLWCGFNSQGYFSANVYAGGVQLSANCIGTPVSIGTWANVAFTYQQNTATSNTIFVWTDGGSQGFNTFSGTVNNTPGNWYIGGDTNLASMTGYISDLRIIIGGTPITSATFSNASTPYSLSPYTGTNNSEVAYTIQSQFSNNYTTSGQYGQALSNTSIQYAISSFPTGTAISASMWVYLLLQPQYVEQFFATNNFTMSLGNNTRGPTGSGSPYSFIMQNQPGNLYNSSATTAQRALLNGWYHVVGVYDSTGYATYYINGTITALANPQQSVPVATTTITIAGGSRIFKGYIDDVRIYNTALTPTQIQTIYQSGGNLYGANTVQPTYMWPFQNSVIDVVKGVAFNKSNVAGVDSNGSWPYYDSIGQRVGSSALLINNSVSTAYASNLLGISSGFTCNFPFTCSFWVRINNLGASGGNSQLVKFIPVVPNGGNGSTIPIGTSTGLNSINAISSAGGSTSSTCIINYPLGTWFHVALVVNLSQLQIYGNGIPGTIGTHTPYSATAYYTGFSMAAAAASGLVSGSCISCEYNDLRIYSGQALSTSQIQTIYQSGGISPSLSLTKVPTYPLAQTSIVSSALGLYSTRALVSTYTGPVVQVRRNSDNTTYNFIADIYGNLSNVQNSTSMGGFLNTTTGNVATWYDQSGAGNHFTQATAVSQPQLVLNSGQWVLWFNRDASPTFYASMTTASSITGVMTILYNYNMSTAFNAYTTLLGSNGLDNTGFRFANLNVFGDAAGGNRAGQDFLGTNGSYCYLNNSYGQMVNETTGARIGNQGSSTASVWNQVIGTQGRQSFSSFSFFNSINAPSSGLTFRTAYGYMSEMMLFSAPINSADAQTLWARTPLTNPLPTKTTSG